MEYIPGDCKTLRCMNTYMCDLVLCKAFASSVKLKLEAGFFCSHYVCNVVNANISFGPRIL